MDDIRCERCGRKLTTGASRDRKLGPKCKVIRDREAAAILREYSDDQIIKAVTALQSEKVRDCGDGIAMVKSSDDLTWYYTGSGCCTCHAGSRRRVCYHTAAVRLLALEMETV